jgi:predicted homoserine dehydrogenase-like protein
MNVYRRSFLLGSAAAARAALAQTTDKVRTALIGTGSRGSNLLQGVLEQPNAKVVALSDIKPDRLDKAATTAGRDSPNTYTIGAASSNARMSTPYISPPRRTCTPKWR